jgi:hypothetical protein
MTPEPSRIVISAALALPISGAANDLLVSYDAYYVAVVILSGTNGDGKMRGFTLFNCSWQFRLVQEP